MKHSVRSLAALLTLIVLGISMPGARQAPELPHWRVGDLFVGIGSWDTATGQYLVYNAEGTPKMVADPLGGADVAETLFDANALVDLDSWGYPEGSYTTGCAVGPDDHLYVTTFWGRKLRRFSPAHPHADPTLVYDFATNGEDEEEQNGIDAIESVVFDEAGNFYVGVHPTPRRDTSADPLNPFTKIFKFPAGYDPATSPAPTVYEVPNGEVGVDWIDLGPDGKTIYYTSESSRVYWYRPADEAQPESAGSFTVHEPEMAPTEGIGGRLYAFRALPPNPGESEPSGFLFAHQRGPVRTDRNGKIQFWYNTPGATGSFFALNISPDGKYFWTANYPSGVAGSGGQLYRFNISHPEPVQGPIATGAPAGVYGICVKREYTAGVNSCYASDLKGNILYDANGEPVVQRDPVTNQPVCKVPEVCGNSYYAVDADGERVIGANGLPIIAAGDEDGDGLSDDADTDCIPSGPPRVLLPNRTHAEFTPINIDISSLAFDPDGDALSFSAAGLPPGLVMSAEGVITGTTPVARAEVYNVTVTVTAGEHTVTVPFTWTITGNVPPELGNPGDVVCVVGYPCPELTLPVHDDDLDSVIATVTVGARPWAPGIDCSVAPGCTGLPPGITLPGGGVTSHINNYNQADYSFTLVGVPGYLGSEPVPGSEGIFVTEICVVDPTIAANHAPTCETFRITILNRAPQFTIFAPNQVHIVGQTMTPVTVAATDEDGGPHLPVTFTATGLPLGTQMSAGGIITGTPAEEAAGRVVTIVASDRFGKTVTSTFTWTVTNYDPSVAGADQVTVAGTTIAPVVMAAADDPRDGTFQWPLSWNVGGVPPGLNAATAAGPQASATSTGTVTFTGTPNVPGDYTVSLQVTDSFLRSGADTFLWRVTNRAPLLTVVPQTHVAGQPIGPITLTATDPDGHPVTYSATGLPAGLTFDSNTRTFTGTPLAPTAPGAPATVTVTVSDPYADAPAPYSGITTVTFPWTITNVAPVPTVAPRTTLVGAAVTDAIPAVDADGHTVTWTITGLPTGLGYDSATGAISGTATTAGVFPVTVAVNDPYSTTEANFTWTVTTNRAPDAVDDAATAVGSAPTPVNVLANDSDPDNDPLTVVPGGFTQPAHGTVALDPGGGFVYAATPGFYGVDTFTYTISDGHATDVATVRITVAPTPICTGAYGGEIWPPNHKRFYAAPISGVTHPTGLALSIVVTGILQDEPVDTTGDGNFTPDGNGVGTAVAWVRAERRGIAGGKTEGDGNGRVYEIMFTATDAAGASCSGSVLWTVPHDQGQHATAIDDGIRYDSTGVIPGTVDKWQIHKEGTSRLRLNPAGGF